MREEKTKAEEKWKKDVAESEKKLEQFKKVLMKSQAKIREQQSQIEKLNNELKDKPAAGATTKGTAAAFQYCKVHTTPKS